MITVFSCESRSSFRLYKRAIERVQVFEIVFVDAQAVLSIQSMSNAIIQSNQIPNLIVWFGSMISSRASA